MKTENEVKHTRGPWMVGTLGKFAVHNPNFVFAKGGEMSICKLNNMPMYATLDDIEGNCLWQEGLANARLIAASPELLEACKAAQRLCELWTATFAPEFCDPQHVKGAGVEIGERGGTLAVIADVNSRLLSAIAKAEGKQ